jgi:CheY-like chemotaxis protein
MASFLGFGVWPVPKQGLDFATFISLAVTSLAAYLAIRIFSNQATQAEVDGSAQAVLLTKIGESSLSAAQRAGSAEGNTAEIIRLLNETQESKTNHSLSPERTAQALSAYAAATKIAGQVLWVDDNVAWIAQERKTLEAAGVATTWVSNTERALGLLDGNSFRVVITDMGRAEGDREGYVLLDAMRGRANNTPLIVYSSSRQPDHVAEVLDHDGQGATNDPAELFELVMKEFV